MSIFSINDMVLSFHKQKQIKKIKQVQKQILQILLLNKMLVN